MSIASKGPKYEARVRRLLQKWMLSIPNNELVTRASYYRNVSEQFGRYLPSLEHDANRQTHSEGYEKQRHNYRQRRNTRYVDEAQQNPVNLLVKQVHSEAVFLE